MRTLIKNTRLILPYEVLGDAWIILLNETIDDFGKGTPPEGDFDIVIDGDGDYLSPGFVDLHNHGGAGHEFYDESWEHVQEILRMHLRHGTTTLLATVPAMSHERYLGFLTRFNQMHPLMDAMIDAPDVPGIHMEGPFIDGNVLGGMVKGVCRDVSLKEADAYLALSPYIKRWTIACEKDHALELGRLLEKQGIMASIGHSDATLEQVYEAFDNGFHSVTHLYSSCSSYHRVGPYRVAGIVEAAFLMDQLDVEIIADGCHLPKEFLKLIYKIKGSDHIALISDASRYTGQDLPEDIVIKSDIPEQQNLYIHDGVAIIEDGSCFCGSIATGDRLIRSMVNLAGVDICSAVRMGALVPARMLQMENSIGSIGRGKRANLVLFDDNITTKHVFHAGHMIL